MFQLIDEKGIDQCGFKADPTELIQTCDVMNEKCPGKEFNVIAFPVVHGPAADRAKAARVAAEKATAEKAAKTPPTPSLN